MVYRRCDAIIFNIVISSGGVLIDMVSGIVIICITVAYTVAIVFVVRIVVIVSNMVGLDAIIVIKFFIAIIVFNVAVGVVMICTIVNFGAGGM